MDAFSHVTAYSGALDAQIVDAFSHVTAYSGVADPESFFADLPTLPLCSHTTFLSRFLRKFTNQETLVLPFAMKAPLHTPSKSAHDHKTAPSAVFVHARALRVISFLHFHATGEIDEAHRTSSASNSSEPFEDKLADHFRYPPLVLQL